MVAVIAMAPALVQEVATDQALAIKETSLPATIEAALEAMKEVAVAVAAGVRAQKCQRH